jgi:hypothetical protein
MTETVAPEWQRWIADNLLRGISSERVIEALQSRGLSETMAKSTVAQVLASPIFQACRTHSRDARRLKQIVQLHRELLRTATHPETFERVTGLTEQQFYDRYYASNTPCVITDLVNRWRAYSQWTPGYFRERFGAITISATVGRESDPDYDINHRRHFREMTMAEFVDRIESTPVSNDFYLIARNLNSRRTEFESLWDDVDFPSWLDRSRASDGSALWFGPAGTITPLHHDTSNILFCQIYGRKRLTLVSPDETDVLENARSMYAGREWDDPDSVGSSARDPVLRKTVDLGPGEALFIPIGWWHHVRSLDVSISLAFNNFTRNNRWGWYVPGKIA